MRILLVYASKGTCYCCSTQIFAIYPNSAIIPTAISIKKFPLYIEDGTIKLIEKPA